MVMNADKYFFLDSIWLATLSFSLLVCSQLDKEYYYSLTSHSSVCHMYDPNGSHSVENEKSVKSTGLFFPFLIMSMICISRYCRTRFIYGLPFDAP